MKKWVSLLVNEVIFSSWWVLLFSLVCYGVYEKGDSKTDKEYSKLYSMLSYLETEKVSAKKHQQNLILQINSQDDPAWVELVLKKGLGLVPQGQTKVFFVKPEQGNIASSSGKKN